MKDNATVGWGSTRIAYTREEFDHIYNIVESPSLRNLVTAFDIVWNWEGLGLCMKENPDALLRWINKIICAIEVDGRSKDAVFRSVCGVLGTYETFETFIPTPQ